MILKKFNKIFLMFLFIFFCFGTLPAFADGGIPLWIYTAHTAIGISTLGSFDLLTLSISIIWILLVMSFVIAMETIFIWFYFKFQHKNEIFLAVTFGNIITTVIGSIITMGLFTLIMSSYHGDASLWLAGPYAVSLNYYGFIIGNILLFLMSFLVEYYIAQKMLKNLFSITELKKSFLYANIFSYLLPLLVAIIGLFANLISRTNTIIIDFPYIIISIGIIITVPWFLYKFTRQ